MPEYPEFEKPSVGHVVINTMVDGGRFECENCGCDYSPALPCPINTYLAMADSFLGDHRECEVRTEHRMGNARLPKELREEEDEETEQECETCGGERVVEGGRICGMPSLGGCSDGMCGGCYSGGPCPDCGAAEENEPDYDSMREARAESRQDAQDEVDWESPE